VSAQFWNINDHQGTPFKPNLLASLTLLAEVGVGNSPSMAGSEPPQSSNGRKTRCKDRLAGEKVGSMVLA